MQQFTDDDLQDVEPIKVTPALVATTKAVVVAAKPNVTVAPVVVEEETTVPTAPGPDDEDVEFGDEREMKFGDGLDRLQMKEKGKLARFALVSKAKAAFVHYIEKKGTYKCLSVRDKDHNVTQEAYCCQKLGAYKNAAQPAGAERIFVALVFHYENSDIKKGGLPKDASGASLPIEWSIKWVKLTRHNYRTITELEEENVKVTDIDMVMFLVPDRAFGYGFRRINAKAVWKQIPQLVAEVEAALKPLADGKKLANKLGRSVSALEFRTVIATLAQGAEEANLGDVEEL